MVITLDRHKKPLGFTTEKRARQLMERRRACIYRYSPFTIILMDKDVRECKDVPEFRLKIDPGSVHTGMAVADGNKVMMYLQCEHRAGTIKKSLDKRNAVRRNRRKHETRYRRSKFADCGSFDSSKEEGWLPPSVKSIGDNVINITKKLKKLINITQCSFEAVRFDTQLLDNPEIEGKQYQQGTLMGYEMKEYLMWRYRHTCQYCGGLSGDSVLEWEHMFPSSRGGSDSVKNATLACHSCNHEKDNMTPKEWLVKIQAKHTKSKLDEERILRIPDVIKHKVTGSDRYCVWVSSVRRYTEKGLFSLFGTVECASGGRTKYNRTKLGLPKDHHYDALCVGTVPDHFKDRTDGYVLYMKAMGRGTRLCSRVNACGIVTSKTKKAHKRMEGKFTTGDIVRAAVPEDAKSKYKGTHTGRAMVRAASMDIKKPDGSVITAANRFCKVLQFNDGYRYVNKRPDNQEAKKA